MKSIVKTMTTIAIVFSVLAILVGVSLIAYPVASILVYGIMFGIYLLVEGIMLVVMSIRARRLHTPFDGLFKGILSIILGIMLLENANAEWMAAYFGIIIGIDIIITGIIGITASLSFRREGAPWVLSLILNIISIIFGAMVLYSPIFSALTFAVFAGIVLIVEAILNIVLMIILRKNAKEVEKIITEKINEINAQEAQEAVQAEVKVIEEPVAQKEEDGTQSK
ncbi:MAG: DUF308 domain-containing protein [Ruminococcaceae bacterium]|nr:DUF308 domain-containing protein [Oscillospiraceae bacterium]MBE6818446.1 DUF308 domain-containing protein [Oscillospiraceae bacterium]